MSIETEKKYRLDAGTKSEVIDALKECGAEFVGRDLEENVIYTSDALKQSGGVIRLRYVGERTLLTYKRRLQERSDVKEQIEHETEVADSESIRLILEELNIKPALVYEKYRDTWKLRSVEVVLDELPFGLFMEIEGTLTGIREAEILLGIEELETVHETYPQMAARWGMRTGDRIEARFKDNEGGDQ
jgi:adenylate cyclase, class 2